MFFLNLSLPEFLVLLGSLSSAVFALYLLDRRRKKHTVATLRFFAALERPPVYQHRRKLQQPWSLVLQLLSLLLLLLAIADLRFGSRAGIGRDHVLIVDTSAWMNARVGQNRLIDRARAAARNYLRVIPSNDRVMVLRADVLATPATVFESDRGKIQQAIDQSQPSAAPLNIQNALEFAEQSQKLQAERPGEIVVVGAARVPSDEASLANLPANLRLIPIAGPTEHVGLRKVSVRRSAADPDTWEIFVALKNYGAAPRSVPLGLQFGGAPVGSRLFSLRPGQEEQATFRWKTRAAGWLEVRVLTTDAFPQDARAILELPARKPLQVTVYSAEPELLRPLFSAIPDVVPTFLPAARYDPKASGGIVVLDGFAPAAPPRVNSIWIEPPQDRSPVKVQSVEKAAKLKQWKADHPLGEGLRAKNIELANSEIFRLSPGDTAVAESDNGPILVAKSGEPKTVVLGFNPVRAGMKYELATPLLFANMVRWMAPDIFRTWESTASTVGTVSVGLETEIDPAKIQVVTEDGKPVPFTVDGKLLRFFSASPGIVRVLAGGREMIYSLTLPEPGDEVWNPAGVRRGLPTSSPTVPSAKDIWEWLAVLAALCLAADWVIFGRMRTGRSVPPASAPRPAWRKAS